MKDFRDVVLHVLSTLASARNGDLALGLGRQIALSILAMFEDEYPSIDIPDELRAVVKQSMKDEAFLHGAAKTWCDVESLATGGEPPEVFVGRESAMQLLAMLINKDFRYDAIEYCVRELNKEED